MNISLNMALTMARPLNRNSPTSIPEGCTDRTNSACSNNFPLYKGISDRPIGWKQKRSVSNPGLGSTARDMSVRRWDGAARRSTEWDCLRKVHSLDYSHSLTIVADLVSYRIQNYGILKETASSTYTDEDNPEEAPLFECRWKDSWQLTADLS